MNNITRRYVYGIATALVPIAVGYGIISSEDATLWIALVASVLVPQLAMQNTSSSEPKHRKGTIKRDSNTSTGNRLE